MTAANHPLSRVRDGLIMIEIVGNIFDLPAAPEGPVIVCITTNGQTNSRREAVMGRGVAKEAADRWPGIARVLGERLRAPAAYNGGNHVHIIPTANLPVSAPWMLASFPTKDHWRDRFSSIDLIERSAHELRLVVDLHFRSHPHARVALPRPGCKNGHLSWPNVRARLAPILPEDRWLIVERDP